MSEEQRYPFGELLWKVLSGYLGAQAGPLAPVLIPLLDRLGRQAIGALIKAQLITMARGYKAKFDNDNPARPPRFFDRDGKEV